MLEPLPVSNSLIYSAAVVDQVSAKYLQNVGDRINMLNYYPEAWPVFYKILKNAESSSTLLCKIKSKANDNLFRNLGITYPVEAVSCAFFVSFYTTDIY